MLVDDSNGTLMQAILVAHIQTRVDYETAAECYDPENPPYPVDPDDTPSGKLLRKLSVLNASNTRIGVGRDNNFPVEWLNADGSIMFWGAMIRHSDGVWATHT